MAAHQLPEPLIRSLQQIPGFDESGFREVHAHGNQVTSVRLNPRKNNNAAPAILENSRPIPWCEAGYYLGERPFFTFDPLLHAGAYYVQEASSMFVEQAVRASVDLSKPLRVLDLCAAPGGKSTHLQALLSDDSLLVSNELIKSRVNILQENMTKWGGENVVVTQNDPRDFLRIPNYFDLIVVDAPCSGSGLFRRDPEAIAEWSEEAVLHCAARQERILSDILPSLKENGVLIYSTCSYSPKEDEDIADFIISSFPVESVPVPLNPGWNITESISDKKKAHCYRFYPDRLDGEGFFLCCFRRTNSTGDLPYLSKKKAITAASKNEESVLSGWLKNISLLKVLIHQESLLLLSAPVEADLQFLAQHLYIRQAGINAGKVLKNDLVPDHALAMSSLLNPQIPSISLKREEALQYLRKQEVKQEGRPGWIIANFEERNLGWIKMLSNRANNYYPKEWRILKQSD